MVFSSSTFTVVAAVLTFGWFLARHKVEGLHSLDGLTLMQLSTQSAFTRAWGSSIAILALPAAAGFGVGWSAHRRSGSATGTAIAAVAVVALAMWQMADKREGDSLVRRAAAAQPVPSTLAIAPKSAPAETATQTTDVKLSIVEEAERNLARAQAEEEATKAEAEKAARAQAVEAAKPAKVAKAAAPADADPASQRKTGTMAPAQPAPDAGAMLLSNRTRLVVQTEAAPPSVGGPGARPTAQPVQEEKALAYPGFPGCRWATPTQWVCDGNKQP